MNQEHNRFFRRIGEKTKIGFYFYNEYEYGCPECDAQGKIDIGPICFKPASECCGGCYQEETCNICDGNRTIELKDDESKRLYDILLKLEQRPHTTAKTHATFSNLIQDEIYSTHNV